MEIYKNKSSCTGCAACVSICPKACITMQMDKEGFYYPHIDAAACINCGKCKQFCPVTQTTSKTAEIESLQQTDKSHFPAAYAAYNKNDQVRLSSSSGGVFTLLAEQFIYQGGLVFGAAMQKDQRTVVHILVDTVEDLEKLRGSKYLQSDTEGIYPQVRTALQAERPVLFSGTPCQIEALHAFLGREYEKLLCVDLICHGVPSPKVWQKYLDYQETSAGAPAQRIFFRHKKYGWKKFALSLEFSNNKAYEQILSQDLFMQAFLRDVCLRPSCYKCPFKKLNRNSDITLADFWGIQDVALEMDDDKGTSLVLVHTPKGQHIFDVLSSQMCSLPVEVEKALKGNTAMTQCSRPHIHRTEFFAMLDKLPFDTLVRRYAKPTHTTVKGIVVLVLKKIGVYELIKKLVKT